jgi:hypothetical protein
MPAHRDGENRRRRPIRDDRHPEVLAILLLHGGDVDGADLEILRTCVEWRGGQVRIDAIYLLTKLAVQAIISVTRANLHVDAAIRTAG